MATLSSAGISGSGLDETMIAKLVALQRQSLVPLQQKASVLDSKISTFGQIKSLMSTLQDAATSLADADTWRLTNATTTNTAVTATVTDANALPGSSVISVTDLARSQSVATAVMPASTQFGAGKLTITMGSWDKTGDQFSNPGTPVEIDIAAGAKLEDVVQAINSKGTGVVASVLKDAQGERLVLRSRATGADAGFTVGASGDASLSALAFNGKATTSSVAQYAQNAEINVNGITVQSTTNEFKQTVPGLNITVNQVTAAATPVTVTVSSDTEGMKKKIQAFMDAYNALNDALASSTKYDAESKAAGVLQGDSTTVGMTNSLRSVVDISRNITEQRNMQVALNYASFQAGLAEMSTTLLHNIGNAINVVIENSYQLRHGCGQLEQVAAAPEATAASAALTAQTVQREAARVVLRRRLAQSVQPRTYRDD